jgi:hypothetical protein
LIYKDFFASAEKDRCGVASGAIWYTSYNFRVEPKVLALKRHLEGGTIGRLYRVPGCSTATGPPGTSRARGGPPAARRSLEPRYGRATVQGHEHDVGRLRQDQDAVEASFGELRA